MENRISNNINFGTGFNYYNGNKRVPAYVHRVVDTFEVMTSNSPNLTLNYNGHSRRAFKFSLSDAKGKVISQKTFDLQPDFLDHKSFKFITHYERHKKINQRAQELKKIQQELEQNIEQPKKIELQG